MNLLLGVELLPTHSLTCTSTICRIYNKEEKSIVLISGKDYIKELVLQGDTDTAEVQDLLRKHGSKPVSSPTEKENILDEGSDELKYIDINWPIPALQVGFAVDILILFPYLSFHILYSSVTDEHFKDETCASYIFIINIFRTNFIDIT